MSPRILTLWPSASVVPLAWVSVASSGSDAGGGEESPFVIGLPASIAAGDGLVLALRVVGDRDLTMPSGWTLLEAPDATMETNGALWLYGRDADGTEGASISVTPDSSARWVAQVHRVEGVHGVSGGMDALLAYHDTESPDPPEITNPWGSAETLYLAFGSGRRTNYDLATPTNYTECAVNTGGPDSDNSTSYTKLKSARRILTASAENPGVFTRSNTNLNRSVSGVVAIRPAA